MLKRSPPPLPWLQALGVGAIAVAGSTLLAVFLALNVLFLTEASRGVASFLEAEETYALLHNAQSATVERYSKWLPVLATTTLRNTRTNIALLQRDHGKLETVTFVNTLINAENEQQHIASKRIGPFLVRGSVEEVERLAMPVNSLSSTNAYRALAVGKHRDEPWLYIPKESYEPRENIGDALFRALLGSDTTALAITDGDSQLRFETFGQTKGRTNTLSSTTTILPGTWFMLHTGQIDELWKTMQGALSRDTWTALESVIGTAAARSFGEDTSLAYDILPLLREETAISVGVLPTGATFFVLSGSFGNPQQLEETMKKFHERFLHTILPLHIEERTFENGKFSAVDIRRDSESLIDAEEERGAWIIHHSEDPQTGRKFLSARTGNHYLIANDTQILEKAMSSEKGVGNSKTSEGFIDGNVLSQRLPKFLPTFLPKQPILWSQSQRWNIAELRIQFDSLIAQ